ncbi:MAG: MogA/MoaB family molybdenum cofactor biosynthesis protein [Elusimicrobia bacterium]|nr:MogA/MoaB family molybdenum cofactor biosynthesis protein [Elusimicrobiota bacterium]
MKSQVGILTMSDRAYSGIYDDQSGPALARLIEKRGWNTARQAIVPDDRRVIEAVLDHWSRVKNYDLILTTGGTGIGPRDVTPDATKAVIDREIPGIGEIMRRTTNQLNNRAALSRSTAGICQKSLIINLPGHPQGAQECFEAVVHLIEHALEMILGQNHAQLKNPKNNEVLHEH